jgi:hypothetical protein
MLPKIRDRNIFVKGNISMLSGILERLKQSCQCDGVEVVRKTVPIVDWLPRYDWRNDLPCDIIAGVTVAIMQIPQGKAHKTDRS